MFIKFVGIDCFFSVILTLVGSLRACHMWLTRNHVFICEIWEKCTSFIFWNFRNNHVITSTNFFIACTSLFNIFPHTILQVWDTPKRVWLLPRSLLALLSVLMIFHLSLLLFYLLCFQFFLCGLLDHLLALALFRRNYMYLLFQSFLPLPLLLFVLVSLFQLLLSCCILFSVFIFLQFRIPFLTVCASLVLSIVDLCFYLLFAFQPYCSV